MIPELCGALIASIFGICTAFRKKTPLFYKIVCLAALTCLMGNIYTVLYGLLYQQGRGGFHVGYFGYLGMFIFLYSSYYGAINSLADGKQPELRRFRRIAGVAAAVFFAASLVMMYCFGKALWMFMMVIPMGLTLYFAVKLLIMPDVEMGIIRVMRPYNALVVGLCFCMIVRLLSASGSMIETVSGICTGLLLAVYLPLARNGVRKWFI